MLCAANASSSPLIDTSVCFKVLHKTWVYEKPTEVIRLIWTIKANVVPHLRENGENDALIGDQFTFTYLPEDIIQRKAIA